MWNKHLNVKNILMKSKMWNKHLNVKNILMKSKMWNKHLNLLINLMILIQKLFKERKQENHSQICIEIKL